MEHYIQTYYCILPHNDNSNVPLFCMSRPASGYFQGNDSDTFTDNWRWEWKIIMSVKRKALSSKLSKGQSRQVKDLHGIVSDIKLMQIRTLRCKV